VLEHAGVISRGREAQWRPCRIAPDLFKQVGKTRRAPAPGS